jgi:hypothetical protein
MTELDKKIIELRKDGYTYEGIQKRLGNPSKKYIRKILLQYDSSLINLECNYNKL